MSCENTRSMSVATANLVPIQELESNPARIRVLRSATEIEEVSDIWASWQYHPNSDLDFYLMIHRTRPKASRPHIIILYRGSRPEAMLVGRIEDGPVEMKLGYAQLPSPMVRVLNIVYAGGLGNLSAENSELLIGQIKQALSQGEADVAVFRYLRTDSPAYLLATESQPLLQRDH